MDVFLTHKVWPPWGLHWKPILPWKIFLSQLSWDCTISQHGLSSGIFHLLNTTAATHIKPHGTPSCVFSQALVQGLTANPHSFLSFLPWHRTTCSDTLPYRFQPLYQLWALMSAFPAQLDSTSFSAAGNFPQEEKQGQWWVIMGLDPCFPSQEHSLLHIVHSYVLPSFIAIYRKRNSSQTGSPWLEV